MHGTVYEVGSEPETTDITCNSIIFESKEHTIVGMSYDYSSSTITKLNVAHKPSTGGSI